MEQKTQTALWSSALSWLLPYFEGAGLFIVILMLHNLALVSHYASQFGSCVIAVPKNCVSAVLSALAQPRDASASPPSPAYEEATAALKVRHRPPSSPPHFFLRCKHVPLFISPSSPRQALESLGDAPAAPAVLRVKHSLADITSLRA